MSIVCVPTIAQLLSARASSAALLCLLVLPLGCRQIAGYSAGPADPRHDGASDARATDGRLDGRRPTDGGADSDGCPWVEVPLASADDDGEIWGSGSFDTKGEEPNIAGEPDGIYCGNWHEGPTWAFFRFTLPTTLTRVDAAHLELWGIATAGVWDPNKHALRLLVEADAHAPPATQFDDRPETSRGRATIQSSLRWPEEGGLTWKIEDYNRSPNLALLFQELAEEQGLGGLVAGMTVQLWLRGDFTDVAAEVTTPYFGAPDYRPARLMLSVCE